MQTSPPRQRATHHAGGAGLPVQTWLPISEEAIAHLGLQPQSGQPVDQGRRDGGAPEQQQLAPGCGMGRTLCQQAPELGRHQREVGDGLILEPRLEGPGAIVQHQGGSRQEDPKQDGVTADVKQWQESSQPQASSRGSGVAEPRAEARWLARRWTTALGYRWIPR